MRGVMLTYRPGWGTGGGGKWRLYLTARLPDVDS